ncbi:MAG: hypothetical protein K0B37_14655 [Bacteroidales bacterium]|nr:hypothetical protein [Bacteroidales bacterium]
MCLDTDCRDGSWEMDRIIFMGIVRMVKKTHLLNGMKASRSGMTSFANATAVAE